MTGLVILGFAIINSNAAITWLSQTVVGDEAVLTNNILAMIIVVAKVNGLTWSKEKATSCLGLFIGKFLGIWSIVFLFKWIPFVGNGINSGGSRYMTEVLGWATYIFITECGGNALNLSDKDIDSLWDKALRLSNAHKKNIYKHMNACDKQEFLNVISQLSQLTQLKNVEDTENSLETLTKKLEEIVGKYLTMQLLFAKINQ